MPGSYQDPWATDMGAGQPPSGFGMGPMPFGMYPGGQQPGMMGGDALSPIRNLDLSDRQRAKLDAIGDELSEMKGALMGEVAKHNEKLRALGDEQRRLMQAIADLQRQITQAESRARSRAEKLLTDQQRQQAQQPWSTQPMRPPPMPSGAGQRDYRGGGTSGGFGGG